MAHNKWSYLSRFIFGPSGSTRETQHTGDKFPTARAPLEGSTALRQTANHFDREGPWRCGSSSMRNARLWPTTSHHSPTRSGKRHQRSALRCHRRPLRHRDTTSRPGNAPHGQAGRRTSHRAASDHTVGARFTSTTASKWSIPRAGTVSAYACAVRLHQRRPRPGREDGRDLRADLIS